MAPSYPVQDRKSRGGCAKCGTGPPCPPRLGEAPGAAPTPPGAAGAPACPQRRQRALAALGASAKVERPRDNEGSESGGSAATHPPHGHGPPPLPG